MLWVHLQCAEHSCAVGSALDRGLKGFLFETHRRRSQCVDNLSSHKVLVKPKKTGDCPDMTEILLTVIQGLRKHIQRK